MVRLSRRPRFQLFVDTDALHIELSDAHQQIAQLKSELKKAQAVVAEQKRRLEANTEKRAALSKECGELRSMLQSKRLEEAKAAARSAAMQRAVDIVTKQDTAIEAQAEHLRRMHGDLTRMRKASCAFLEKYKQQLDGSSADKSRN